MPGINAADGANAFHRSFVADMTAECITGVGWINDDAAVADDFRRAFDQARLRIVRMYGKKLRHGK